jgi:hypothetical protein
MRRYTNTLDFNDTIADDNTNLDVLAVNVQEKIKMSYKLCCSTRSTTGTIIQQQYRAQSK